MSKEYFENSKSKTTFVVFGVVVVLLLMLICSSATSLKSLKKISKETPSPSECTSSERRSGERDPSLEIRNPNLELLPTVAQPTHSKQSDVSALQSSLYQDGETLVGFLKSSNANILKKYKQVLKQYADIIRSSDTEIIFMTDDSEVFETIYQLLEVNQPSLRDAWNRNW